MTRLACYGGKNNSCDGSEFAELECVPHGVTHAIWLSLCPLKGTEQIMPESFPLIKIGTEGVALGFRSNSNAI